MAITFVEQRKKQKALIWVLIIIVLIALVSWQQGFFEKPPFKKVEKPSVFELKKIKINFEVLEIPILKELQSFEKIKPFEGEIGRENPFISY